MSLVEQNVTQRPPVTIPSPFDSSDYLSSWWHYIAPQFKAVKEHADWFVYRRALLSGLLQFQEIRMAGWNADQPQALSSERLLSLQALCKTSRWDAIRLCANANAETADALQMFQATGLTPVELPASPQYVLDMREGWEGYWKSVSQNTRKSFRRKMSRSSHLKPALFNYTGEVGFNTFFELFFKAHIPYWESKTGASYLSEPLEQMFILAWMKQCLAQMQDQTTSDAWAVELQGLSMGDEVVNLSINLTHGSTLYHLLTINTGAYAEHYPGLVALCLNAQQAAASGIRFFNMGPGNYFFKKQAANLILPQKTILIPNSTSVRGKAYVRWLQNKRQETSLESVENGDGSS